MAWIENFEELVDFLSMVAVCAPDSFPKEDYLRDDEQLTLERAFDELRQGIRLVAERTPDDAVLEQLRECLEDAFASYKQGNDIKGAHLLQDSEGILLRINR